MVNYQSGLGVATYVKCSAIVGDPIYYIGLGDYKVSGAVTHIRHRDR